jgi:hypothetical protein
MLSVKFEGGHSPMSFFHPVIGEGLFEYIPYACAGFLAVFLLVAWLLIKKRRK